MIKRIVIQHRAICALAVCCAVVEFIGCGRPVPPMAEPVNPNGSTTIPGGEDGQVSLKILDYAGLQQLIANKRGKVIVLDAWSTGCPPCVKEFPDLVALSRKIGPERLACISLSLDYEGVGKPLDVAPAVTAFLSKQKATFDNVLASEEPEAIYKKLEIASIPAVFVFDQSGDLRKRFTEGTSSKGIPVYDRVEELVRQLLQEK